MRRRCKLLTALALCVALPSFAAQAQDKTLRLWTFLNPNGTEARENALKQIIAKFEAAHPGVKVQVEQQVWTQMTPKFLAAHASGTAPDVIWVHSEMLGKAISGNTLADLNKLYFASRSDDGADLDNVFWQFSQKDDAQHSVALTSGIFGLVYRMDLFEKAGIKPDSIRTWADLEQAAAKLTTRSTDGNVTRWGLCQHFGKAPNSSAIFISTVLSKTGDKMFSPEGKADWANPAGEEGLRRVVDLVQKAKVSPPDAINWTEDDMYDQFAADRCAMATGFSSRVARAQQTLGKDKVGFMGYPSDDPGKPSPQIVNAWFESVWSKGKNTKEAAEFVAYTVSPEADRIWVTVGGTIPNRKSTLKELQDFLAKPENQYLGAAAEYIQKAGWFPPIDADIAGYRDFINVAIQKVLTGQATPKDALEEAQSGYNRKHGFK